MMPVIIACEKDLVDLLMKRINVPGVCHQCGTVHPQTAEDVTEFERVVRMAVSTYRVKHVLSETTDPKPPLSLAPVLRDAR